MSNQKKKGVAMKKSCFGFLALILLFSFSTFTNGMHKRNSTTPTLIFVRNNTTEVKDVQWYSQNEKGDKEIFVRRLKPGDAYGHPFKFGLEKSIKVYRYGNIANLRVLLIRKQDVDWYTVMEVFNEGIHEQYDPSQNDSPKEGDCCILS